MNFLFMNRDCRISGGTTYLLALAEGLIQRGCQVTLAAGNGIQTARFDQLGVRRLLTLGGKLSAWRVALDVRRNRPDAIVYGGRGSTSLMATRMLSQTGAAGICVLQDHMTTERCARIVLASDAVIALEQPILDQATAAGVPSEKLHCWPRPVLGAAPPLTTVNVDPLKLLWIGRMSGYKAWSAFTLIGAMPSIVNHAPGVELRIVGGGSRAARIRRAAKAMNRRLGRQVIRTQRPTNNPLLAMADASIVIGGGYTCLEALYNGRPAIASGFEWMGPVTRDRVPDAYDQHFGDRSPGRTDEAGMATTVCDVYDSLLSGESTYQPCHDWFPVDHSPVGHADQLLRLVQRVRADKRLAGQPTLPARHLPQILRGS